MLKYLICIVENTNCTRFQLGTLLWIALRYLKQMKLVKFPKKLKILTRSY